MKKIGLTISALVLVSSAVFSQGQLDAYKYAQTDLFGTARYLSMGGAFGALGGDISAMSSNPAGLAVYRSSEVVTTLSLNSVSAESNWAGSKSSESRTRLFFDNIAYVGYFPTSNDEGIVGWNVGFSYNRVKNFSRNYSMRGNNSKYSLSDYVAARAYGWDEDMIAFPEENSGNTYNPYNNQQVTDWFPVLGYGSGYIDNYADSKNTYTSAFGSNDDNGNWQNFQLQGSELNVSERGAIDQYNIAFGMNISDRVMLGATVAITDISYHYNSYYAEDFTNSNYLELENWLDTEGTGYAFNLGAIVRPTDYLRVGVAYNSPVWYKMTDYYDATASTDSYYWEKPYTSYTPEGAYSDYEFRAPDKWLFSAAAILGQTALISVDYELTNYKNMKMYRYNGSENQETNADINSNFSSAGTLRVGAEVKVTPQFAVRAGAAWIGNPMKDALKNATEEVKTVGTIPHYTINKSISNYTLGLGYRFTPSFYMDLACILKSQKEDLYAFSNIYDNELKETVFSPASSLKTNTTRVALTLGYKF